MTDSLEDRIRKAREEWRTHRRFQKGPYDQDIEADSYAKMYAAGVRLARLLEEKDARDVVPESLTIADLRETVSRYSNENASLKRQLAERPNADGQEMRRLIAERDSALRYLATARAEAIEECAKVCEKSADAYFVKHKSPSTALNLWLDLANVATGCANAIRALKEGGK